MKFIFRGQISILCLVLLCGAVNQLQAQPKMNTAVETEKIWSLVEPGLDQPKADTLGAFILHKVRDHCGKDYECMFNTYQEILSKLEYRNKFLVALPVSKEMVKLARQHKDFEGQTNALKSLIELYNFLEDTRMVLVRRQELLELYEAKGDQAEIIRTKVHILESRAWQLNETAQILPEVEALLDQAVKLNLAETANFLRTRLKYLYEEFGYDDKLEKIVAELEDIPVSDPIKPSESRYVIHASSGRADLLRKEGRFDEAAALYREALSVARLRLRAHFDTWLEVYVLLRLGSLEWDRGNNLEAQAYLDTAFSISDEFNMHGHTVTNLALQAQIAETENRFADALYLTRQKQLFQTKMDSVSSGFDVKKYHLQLAKEELTAEKEKQALDLQLKKSQLRYSLIIAVLALMIAIGLYVGFHKQIQARQKLTRQNELIQLQAEQLKNLDAAKSRFFANISHELRTPLTLLLGPIYTLQKEKDLNDRQKSLLKMARKSGQQLSQLINDILDLRKLEIGKLSIQAQAAPLASFFRRSLAQFESLGERKNLIFHYQVNIHEDLIANFDAEKFRQILHNLLSNAFKFTTENQKIEVKIYLQDEQLCIKVADTGQGIPEDDLPHLFDRYFQSYQSNKPAQGGSGIGLALCKEYAEFLGGSIKVESKLGEGSVFTVILPIERYEASSAEQDKLPESLPDEEFQTTRESLDSGSSVLLSGIRTPRKADQHPDKPRILVVEDNLDLQEYISLILSDKYKIITADNGRQALDFLNEQALSAKGGADNIQLILSDLMMPVMDGFQLLEQLKTTETTRHIPVIMLTARADIQDKLRALRIGVDDYLLKPFEEEELQLRIENLLKNQQVRQQELTNENPQTEEKAVFSEQDQEWLTFFEEYVEQNISSSLLNIPNLSHEFAMSESTLLRQLKRLTGLTPAKYLQEVRLNKARKKLERESNTSISQLAQEVGYADARSFSRSFKKRFGKLPSEI